MQHQGIGVEGHANYLIDSLALGYHHYNLQQHYDTVANDFYSADYQPNYNSMENGGLEQQPSNAILIPQQLSAAPVLGMAMPGLQARSMGHADSFVDIKSVAVGVPRFPSSTSMSSCGSLSDSSVCTIDSTQFGSESPFYSEEEQQEGGCDPSIMLTGEARNVEYRFEDKAVTMVLPAEICTKVFCPPSALNPQSHSRTPRRGRNELSSKRVHHCKEPGTLRVKITLYRRI